MESLIIILKSAKLSGCCCLSLPGKSLTVLLEVFLRNMDDMVRIILLLCLIEYCYTTLTSLGAYIFYYAYNSTYI